MLRQVLFVTLGLAVCFMGTAEAGRHRGGDRRGRRRRRRRRSGAPATTTPCATCEDNHQVAATGSFKGGKKKKGRLAEGEGACDCLNLCAGTMYYQIQQKKGGAQDCYCASGKLKKMKASKKAFLGGVTVELSTALAEMAEKSSVTPNTVCSAETPAPTDSPTPSPTDSPTASPTASPTTRYVVGTLGSNECPEGSIPIRSMDACWAAAASLSIVATDGVRQWTGEADAVPPRCSYQAGAGGDNAPHWNTKVGSNDGGYTPICDQGPPAADMLLMRLLGGSDGISAANVWNSGGGVSSTDNGADNYRADAVSSWGDIVRDYKYVKVSVMEDGGNTEAQYMTFNTAMTDSLNWYSKDAVAGSSWNLDSWTGVGEQYFQLNEQCCGREFLVSHNYGGCDQDNGWLNLDAASQWVGGKRDGTTWGNQYSEENGGWSGRSNTPFVGGWCGGGNCDNHKNIWANNLGDWHNGWNWGGEVSDNESWTGSHTITTTYQCPADEVVSELRCQGDRCDNITVYCSGAITTTEYRLINADANTHWAKWFSEEGNGQGWCGENQVIIGLQCKGDYCDDMSWRCREFQKDLKNDPCPWEHDDKSVNWKSDGHKFQIIYSKGDANENFLNGNVARAHSVKITATNTL